jgi:hypothetical protein
MDGRQLLQRLRTSLRLRLGRRFVRLRQAVSRPTRAPTHGRAAPDRDAVPILVVGCHRSGTSLVRRILDSHSRIACPPETQIFEALGRFLEDPDVVKGLGAVHDLDAVAADLGQLARKWLSDYAVRKGKARWAEKSPGTFHRLEAVDRMFGQQALFLLVVRDGMDVATSLGKGRWSVMGELLEQHEDPYVAASHYWVMANQKMSAFREAVPDRTCVLRYEDLVQRPEVELQRVFAFLGEPWEPEVLDFNRFEHDGGVEDHVVSSTWRIEDGRGKYLALPRERQQAMWAVIRPTALALGYDDKRETAPAR